MSSGMDATFDGVSGNAVFCSWTGSNPMSSQRAECLLSIYASTGCPVLLLTAGNIHLWEVASDPFHPAFRFLSATQKADYLRCYVMHHHGGGHTDIKRTSRPWNDHFRRLREAPPEIFGVGYTEIGPHGVAPVGGALEVEMRENYARLIGNCAYIFRPRSAFTHEWFRRTHLMLDEMLPELEAHPAQHPQDHKGVILPDGTPSQYPLIWLAFCNIFHELVYLSHERFLHIDEIAPQFHTYR